MILGKVLKSQNNWLIVFGLSLSLIFLSIHAGITVNAFSIGDKYTYYVKCIESTKYDGEVMNSKTEENYTLEILKVEKDKVIYKEIEMDSVFIKTEKILNKDNLTLFTLGFPYTFVNPEDFNYFYEWWQQRDGHSASNRRFVSTYETSNYTFLYGVNENGDFLYDNGSYKYFFECTYTSSGVLEHVKTEEYFVGKIIEFHRNDERQLMVGTNYHSDLETITLALNLSVIIVSLLFGVLWSSVLFKKKRGVSK